MFSLIRQLLSILAVLAVFSSRALADDDAAEHTAEIKKLSILMNDAIEAKDLEAAIKHQEAVVFKIHAANQKKPDDDLREDSILHSDLLTMLKASNKLSNEKREKLFSVFEGIKAAKKYDAKLEHIESIGVLVKTIEIYSKELAAPEMKYLEYDLQWMLGSAYQDIGELEKSVEAFSRVREIRIKHYGETHPDLLGECRLLSECKIFQGDFASADLYCRDYLERDQRVASDYGINYAAGLSVLAVIQLSNNRSPEAEAFSLLAIAIAQKSSDKPTFTAARSYLALAEVYMLRGDQEKSKQLYLKSLFTFKEVAGEDSFQFAEAAKKYAVLLKVMGNGDEALRMTKYYKNKFPEMSKQ
jgi:tetratricopeptide (TPR) repeat protein